jgi:hypothetical protein
MEKILKKPLTNSNFNDRIYVRNKLETHLINCELSINKERYETISDRFRRLSVCKCL